MNGSRIAALARRPAVGMAAGTVASRATGLARTVALAWALGVGTASDAYNIANTAPNMLFTLVAGGTLTSALVPMLARAKTDEERSERASVVLGTVAAWSVGASILLIVFAPVLMHVLTAGAGGSRGGDLSALGVRWLRMFGPQVAFYAIGVAATSVMAAHRRLTLGAFASTITNVLTIAACAWFVALAGRRPDATSIPRSGVAVLGLGTTAGVAAMALLQLAGARRAQPGLRITPRVRHPAVTELRRLGGWMIVYVGVNQVAYAAVVAMASSVDGGVTAYQWAFMLMQVPYAVVAVSIFSSAYPELSRAVEDAEAVRTLVRAVSARTAALLLPAAAGVAITAGSLATALVGSADASLVAAALRGFAMSLVPFAMFQLLTRTSYARGDTKTPALVNLAVNAAMVFADVAVLVSLRGPTERLAGLAIGHSISYFVGCAALGRSLRRDGRLPRWSEMARDVRAPAVATVGVAVVLLLLPDFGSGRMQAVETIGAVGVLGVALYTAALYVARRSPLFASRES